MSVALENKIVQINVNNFISCEYKKLKPDA
jgi:hypothetical protein